ncbi:hypothetical protein DX910_14535 [Acinetobacter haemolyticus]|nr:hypothetical protein DX910_14535 [Acinetobacter haemolyticus]
MITTKLEEMNDLNLKTVAKHCDPEIKVWHQVGGEDIGTVLTDYYKFSTHIMIQLANTRAELAKLKGK